MYLKTSSRWTWISIPISWPSATNSSLTWTNGSAAPPISTIMLIVKRSPMIVWEMSRILIPRAASFPVMRAMIPTLSTPTTVMTARRLFSFSMAFHPDGWRRLPRC